MTTLKHANRMAQSRPHATKPSSYALVVSVMLLLLVVIPAHADTDTNVNRQLLKNPDFEMGTHVQRGLDAVVPKHWSRPWRKQGSVEPVQGVGLAYRGEGAARVTDSSMHQGRFEVTPGMRYRVRAWIKGETEATCAIVFYQYVWTESDGRKRQTGVGTWGFRGGYQPAPEQWTMIERVYTAPDDGSVDMIAFAFHIKGADGQPGSVLIDSVTARAWDGRPLGVRVASSAIFRERPGYEQAMAQHPEFKQTRGDSLAKLYATAEALREQAQNPSTPLPDMEDAEARFEQLLDDYAKLRVELELDLEEF